MEAFGLRPQTMLTFPILVGTDGVLRMSKTTGNHIGINEPPEVMFGKVMSIPDVAMRNFFDLVTRFMPDEIDARFSQLERGELHPRDLKMQLAFEIVDIFHGRDAAEAAQAHFRTVFQQRELPSDMPELKLLQPVNLADLLTNSGLAPSKSEARRLVQQGGVRLDGERVDDLNRVIAPDGEHVLQVGRRKFVRLVP
jgi:tyrosyl-tRNA synthetase